MKGLSGMSESLFHVAADNSMRPKKLLCLMSAYPTLSQTYKENELRFLAPDFDIMVGSLSPSAGAYKTHMPFRQLATSEDMFRLIDDYKPDIIHGHYLNRAETFLAASRHAKTRYTLRTHSFDILGLSHQQIASHAPAINNDHCAGILVYPFLIEKLLQSGINPDKIVPDMPVVNIPRFLDTTPNGSLIMNTGACLPKKAMPSYVDLAAQMPDREFVLYPISYNRERLIAYNAAKGSPVDIRETVEPAQMPTIYKNSEWLVYTASMELATVGWPMAIAEAQASGAGVLIQHIRPDMEDFLGGAGFTFKTLAEAREILSKPYPATMRERGFEVAKRCDIATNITKLHRLWDVRITPPPQAISG